MNRHSPEAAAHDLTHPMTPKRRHRHTQLAGFSAGACAARATLVTLVASTASVSQSAAAAKVHKPGSRGAAIGMVSTAPDLPRLQPTFKSRFVQANGIRQHAVIGGDGPPLLLVHGWPENWYAWRHVMPELAKDYTVIAVDQRGIGRSEKTATGTTRAPSPTTWPR